MHLMRRHADRILISAPSHDLSRCSWVGFSSSSLKALSNHSSSHPKPLHTSIIDSLSTMATLACLQDARTNSGNITNPAAARSFLCCISLILFMASLIRCGIMRQLTTRHTPIWVPVMRSISQPASHKQRAPSHLGLSEARLSRGGRGPWWNKQYNLVKWGDKQIPHRRTDWRPEHILQYKRIPCTNSTHWN